MRPPVLLVLAALAVLPSCDRDGDGAPTGPDVDAAGEASLPSGVWRLDGSDPSLPADDLAPLAGLIEGAEIVGLGESVHTSGGYYQMKHRLFADLVETHGIRAFAFENPAVGARRVGDLVDRCGTVDEAELEAAVSDGLFGVWASDEVVALVGWMCGWNASHPDDRVRFFGIDVQSPFDDGPELSAFLAQTAPDAAAALIAPLASCLGATLTIEEYFALFAGPQGLAAYPPDELARCHDGLTAIETYLDDHRSALEAASTPAAVVEAGVRVVALRANSDMMFLSRNSDPASPDDFMASFEARDRGMAESLLRLRPLFTDRPIALWAHNGHLAARADEIASYEGKKNLGTFLRERLDRAYVPIGLVGYHVEIDWAGFTDGPTELPPPATDDDVEGILHRFEASHLLVDLRAEDGLLPDGRAYIVGDERMIPADQFRALVFLETSPAMHPLLW